jgi:hypothetical protein
VLCASSGGAALADCLAWALSSRAVTAAGVAVVSVSQSGAEQQQSALAQLASPQRQQKRDGSSSVAKQSDAAVVDSAAAASSGSNSSNVLEALLGRAAAAVLAPCASCLSLLLRHVPRSEVRAELLSNVINQTVLMV